MKFLGFSISIFYILSSLFFVSPPIAHAESTDPFPPFSIEGNPDEDYHFNSFFPLLKYIRPRALKIFENRDRSREYEPLEICSGGDQRDLVCEVDNQTGEEIDGCDGGPVDICNRHSGEFHHTAYSGPNGSCSAKANPDLGGTTRGKCSYLKRPSISRTIKGTDYSGDVLTFNKLQNEANAYSFVGNPENPITYGAHQLMFDFNEKIILQLMVVKRAKETKSTLEQTGEWPLGWVDWGYEVEIDDDLNPDTPKVKKKLIDIHDALPGGVSGAGLAIIEADDDFFLTGGNLDIISDVTSEKKLVAETVANELSRSRPAQWAIDLSQAPMYPPSFRQGFVRPSICKWNFCCPNPDKCPLPTELLIGTRRGLYYDISISQAFNASLAELMVSYPLNQSVRIFKDLAATNPLIRFAGSSSINAIPSAIHERLYEEQKDGCLKYIPWSNWAYFGQHIDYLNIDDFLGPNRTCPDYAIAPALTKDPGGAYPSSSLFWLLNLIWGEKTDEVDQNKFHLITVPEAMGQSIEEIQQTYYDTRDTLTELERIKEFNEDLSSTIDDEADKLLIGKSMNAADPRRRMAYYTCNDDMFSSQDKTSVEAYALGTRIGCFDTTTAPEGKCNGQLFAQLIEGTSYQSSSPKGEEYFNTYIKDNLTPELMNTYAAAEQETGVPCEILAGIHFVEASNHPEGSLVSGRKLGTPEPDAGGKVFRSLLETAVYAGGHLKGKVGGTISDAQTAITALSRYNGGGNSNCQLGYPYPIPYGGCPRQFEGEDDPYPTSFIDSKHDNMYLLYCADHTACVPQIFQRPGSFTVAINVYNSITKSGYENSELPPTQVNPPPPPVNPPGGGTAPPGFFPRSCGPESISTALGCLPYTRDAFTSTLLGFVVGISGAIALISMLIATFLIMTAGSNAEQLKKGKELFSAAVMGLLFLIFSVSLLRIIAGDIIRLPGF